MVELNTAISSDDRLIELQVRRASAKGYRMTAPREPTQRSPYPLLPNCGLAAYAPANRSGENALPCPLAPRTLLSAATSQVRGLAVDHAYRLWALPANKLSRPAAFSCARRRAVQAGNYLFPGGRAGEFWARLHCKPGRAVQIEPGLRPKSPESGNYSMDSQRLSAYSTASFGKWESGDRLPNCKSPPLAGFSAMS